MEKIAICVCTRERPKMLKRCLERLIDQRPPEGSEIVLVVVDNSDDGSAEETATEAAGGASFPVFYVNEPDPGVPQARNAALAFAYSVKADWIVFIDDDEWPDSPWWLGNLRDAIDRHKADVALGPVMLIYPEDAPLWRRRSQYGDAGKDEGQVLSTAATNNVIVRTAAIPEFLTFAPELRFVGGEDTLFFREMNNAGAKIVWTKKAVAFEAVPWDRITIAGHARRSFRKGYCSALTEEMSNKRNPRIRTVMRSIRRLFSGLMKISVFPLLLIFGMTFSMKTLLSGCRNFSESLGTICYFLKIRPSYYKKVTGE